MFSKQSLNRIRSRCVDVITPPRKKSLSTHFQTEVVLLFYVFHQSCDKQAWLVKKQSALLLTVCDTHCFDWSPADMTLSSPNVILLRTAVRWIRTLVFFCSRKRLLVHQSCDGRSLPREKTCTHYCIRTFFRLVSSRGDVEVYRSSPPHHSEMDPDSRFFAHEDHSSSAIMDYTAQQQVKLVSIFLFRRHGRKRTFPSRSVASPHAFTSSIPLPPLPEAFVFPLL